MFAINITDGLTYQRSSWSASLAAGQHLSPAATFDALCFHFPLRVVWPPCRAHHIALEAATRPEDHRSNIMRQANKWFDSSLRMFTSADESCIVNVARVQRAKVL